MSIDEPMAPVWVFNSHHLTSQGPNMLAAESRNVGNAWHRF